MSTIDTEKKAGVLIEKAVKQLLNTDEAVSFRAVLEILNDKRKQAVNREGIAACDSAIDEIQAMIAKTTNERSRAPVSRKNFLAQWKPGTDDKIH